ncbi:MAG: TlpA disulfide reductase family protein [Planctomycetota bacterium]
MVPHLVKWNKKWSRAGLRIIDIDNGRIDSKDALAEHIEKQKLAFPVIWDEKGRISQTYEVGVYPTAVLLGTDGNVVWQGVPLNELRKLEKRIEAELRKVKREKRTETVPKAGKDEKARD